jgi:hypothetical protein
MSDLADAIRRLEAEKAMLLAQLYRSKHAKSAHEVAKDLKEYVVKTQTKEPLRVTYRDTKGQRNLWKQEKEAPAEERVQRCAVV